MKTPINELTLFLNTSCRNTKKFVAFSPNKTRPSKMEIYHRDHWIIIVHTATWKDLTKWNEENTINDWINHMEGMVKHVSSMLASIWKRLQGIICTISYLYIKSRTPGTRLCKAISCCTRLLLSVFGCIWLYLAVPGWTRLYLAVIGCTRLYLAVVVLSLF